MIRHRHRPLVNLLLGLVFLVQGYAVAAGPAGAITPPPDSATTAPVPPCHDMPETLASDERTSCCDAGCPHMAACALGHASVATLPLLALPEAASLRAPVLALNLPAARRSLPIRPPIPLHG